MTPEIRLWLAIGSVWVICGVAAWAWSIVDQLKWKSSEGWRMNFFMFFVSIFMGAISLGVIAYFRCSKDDYLDYE